MNFYRINKGFIMGEETKRFVFAVVCIASMAVILLLVGEL